MRACMKLTKNGEYALRTLIQLGIAGRLGRDVVSVSDLAESENLPCKFIENILDRYTLDDVVSVTMRKMECDGVELPFDPEPDKDARRGGERRVTKPQHVEHTNLLDAFLAPVAPQRKTSRRP